MQSKTEQTTLILILRALFYISNYEQASLVGHSDPVWKGYVVIDKGYDLDGLLEPLLFAYRTTPHSSTGETPFFVI